VSRARRASYTVGRALGDWAALTSGSPMLLLKRLANRWIGRNVVRRMWFR